MVSVFGRCTLREALSVRCICAALLTVCCLTLSTVPPAHAGKGKPNVVRTAGQHVKGGWVSNARHYRHSLRGNFKRQRFHKQAERSGFVKRRDRKRHTRKRGHSYAPIYYYGYGRRYRYRNYSRSEPSYRSEATAPAQPDRTKPVTPKWVHVGGAESALGSYTVEELYAEGGGRRNCLSVRMEITVDGKPLDAVGEACLLADGAWELRPSEQND